MKSLFFLSFLFLALASATQDRYYKEPFLTKPLTAETIRAVEAFTAGGSIAVTGVGENARIEVYVAPGDGRENLSKEELQKRLDENYELRISVEGGKLLASAKAKDKKLSWKESLSIAYKIFIPKNVSTQLKTSGGSIQLRNLSGSQEFSTSGGSLQVEGVSGKINGVTSGGSIQLDGSKDEIELVTSGGSIEARNSEGRLRLMTSGGSLSLVNLKGTVNAVTSGGSISGKNIEGELTASTLGGSVQLSNLSCSLNASTNGGHMDVSFAALGAYIKISNSGGNVDLELPKGKGLDLQLSAARIKMPDLENFSGKAGDEEVAGKWNGGGVPVTVKARDGRIYLSQK